jgi:hypothetical protein
MTYVQIGAQAGIAPKDVRRLVTGRDSRDRRGIIPLRTDATKAQKLLAVTL